MPSRPGYHNVKLNDDGFARLNKIVAQLSQHGWSVLGLKSTDRVSSINVLGVAVSMLESRLKKR